MVDQGRRDSRFLLRPLRRAAPASRSEQEVASQVSHDEHRKHLDPRHDAIEGSVTSSTMANGSPGVELDGTVVGGRYEVVCPISSGAMGAVFRARETDNVARRWRSSG